MAENLGYIPYDQYAALPGERWSVLRKMATSPLAYWWELNHAEPPTDSMILGCAVHTALFEPDELEKRYSPWYARRAGKEWAEFQADAVAAGSQTIRGADYDKAQMLAEVTRQNPQAKPYLDGALGEQTYTWTDRDTGLLCRSRLDCVQSKRLMIAELKTTNCVDEYRFGGTAGTLLYPGQLAFQAMAYCAVHGGQVPDVRIIAIQTVKEPDVAVFQIPEPELTNGEELALSLLRQVKACQESGQWPGRYTEERMLPVRTRAGVEDDSLMIDGVEVEV